MHLSLLLLELVVAVTLMQSLLVAAKVLPAICGNCGLQLERRELGEQICRCDRG